MKKLPPFTKETIQEIKKDYPTPFYLYDEQAIRENARALLQAFSWAEGFKEYFAVKANPNPHLLKILKEEGFGVDCSSIAELILSEKVGFKGQEIMFTSNNTPYQEYQKAKDLGAVINLDDISHIDYLEENVGLPEMISCRYNPGPKRAGNDIIGKPEEAKFGMTTEQIFQAYQQLQAKGVKRFGLHTMIISNELNPKYFIETAEMMFKLALEIKEKLDIQIELINFGGGIGIPYRPEEKAIDYQEIAQGVQKAYQEIIIKNQLDPIRLALECGRVITGPYGYLITQAIHKKDTYKNYIGVDATMADLMRPGIYGAYHHITVLGKETSPKTKTYDVVGSLCENSDKFAIDRQLPAIENGDYLVLHDAGAHGHAMGYNYNGKLRPAELLLRPDKSYKEIRRRETLEDYFQTLDFSEFEE